MIETWNGILDAWNEPSTRHAMVVHMPIVLSIVGAALTVVVAIRPKNHTARWFGVAVFAVAAVSGQIAFSSGLDAEGAMGSGITQIGDEILQDHQLMGDKVRLMAAALAFILALTAFETKWVRVPAVLISVIGALFTAGWVGVTAHYGGQLVYEHGIGVRSATAEPGETSPDESTSQTVDPRVDFFISKVRPILEADCWGCHNPVRAKGELDMTTMAGILAGGESFPGEVVVPGVLEKSVLITAIRYEDPFLIEMPPPKNGQLDPEEIAVLEQWVRDGAVWQVESLEGRQWESDEAADGD